MNDFERPPLDPIVQEQIRQLLHEVDEQHWPLISEFLVPKFIPLAIPVPPQRPLQFLSTLQCYASVLFKTEADQYEQFRSNRNYPPWLSKLEDRVVSHVLDATDKIEGGNITALLGYHGVSRPQIEEGLRQTLSQIRNHYTWKDVGPHSQIAQDVLASQSKEEFVRPDHGGENRSQYTALPSATIIGVAAESNEYVAWNGKSYVLRPTKDAVLADGSLRLIGGVRELRASPARFGVAGYIELPVSELHRQDEATHPQKAKSDNAEIARRSQLLEDYKAATGNPPNQRIYTAKNSGIHKAEFYSWINGKLPKTSSTTINFEMFLSAKKPPIPRKPKH